MNNNRNNNNNNRRRGRGNNRGGGNPSQSNRIDSRARGNAPQMLDKYKKLAQEAQLNDDRVQTEYYLQFADHYFRVMADMKSVKDDQRPRRDGERDQDGSDYDDDSDGEDGYNRQEARPTDRDENRRHTSPRRDDNRGNDYRRSDEPLPVEGREGERGDQSDEDNPFTRDAPRNKQRAPRKPMREAEADEHDGGLDPDMLPPSIARTLAADSENDGADTEAAASPKPRRQLRPRRPRSGDGEEALEAVG